MSRRQVRQLLTIVVAIAAAIVVVLLVLIAAGVLVLPAKSPTPVTITSVTLEIREGNTSGGMPWFGPSTVVYNSTDSNYPLSVAPGGTWKIVWVFDNFDNHFHNISQVLPAAPFTLGTTQPNLPYEVLPGEEDCALAILPVAPSTPGASYHVTIVVAAQTTP